MKIIIILFLLSLCLTMTKRNRSSLCQDKRNVRRRLLTQQKKEQQKVKEVVIHKIKRCFAIQERKRKSREFLTRIEAIKRYE
jgi:hypothetical protein